jgi:paraquat-inducible protein A
MEKKRMPPPPLTAQKASLVSCTVCHLLIRKHPAIDDSLGKCPRCGATLRSRKRNSITRTWALILAAFLFYIPANLIPITKVTSLGVVQTDTIMSGVIYFITTGMWPIGLIIFVASVFVPLFKLIILTFLVVSVQRRSIWRPRDRTRLYRLTEAIGRWSMVDIFVVTILVALVHLGAIANIEAQKGVVFFAAVVVITMFAAMTFDPRLIWDTKELEDVRKHND